MGEREGRLWILLSTFPDRASALAAARTLVREDLAACAQVGADLVSIYRWEGALQEEAEVALALKIRDDRYDACVARLAALHPHAVPQLLGWPADRVGEAYSRWVWGEAIEE
jgi:periplasmic divalent cation tolerance protein